MNTLLPHSIAQRNAASDSVTCGLIGRLSSEASFDRSDQQLGGVAKVEVMRESERLVVGTNEFKPVLTFVASTQLHFNACEQLQLSGAEDSIGVPQRVVCVD